MKPTTDDELLHSFGFIKYKIIMHASQVLLKTI